jgi:hypothetical protein
MNETFTEIGTGQQVRSRTREELAAVCADILRNDPWDDNAVLNSADRLADLLMELTGNTGIHRE